MKFTRHLLVAVVLLSSNAVAQDLALDHPVRCGPLQCFPRVSNPNEFYYLPRQPQVSVGANGRPEFSVLR